MSSSFYPRRRSAIRSREFSVHPPRTSRFSPWFFVSVTLNIVLASFLVLGLRNRLFLAFFSASVNEAVPDEQTSLSQAIDGEPTDVFSLLGLGLRNRPFLAFFSTTVNEAVPDEQTSRSQAIDSEPKDDAKAFRNNPRRKLEYDEWVSQLKREADAVARARPENLSILLGDSISLWFPHEFLPEETTWLNQGISGEGSLGLLKRLNLIAKTEPRIIYLMIGINDLLRDVSDDTLLANQQQIIQDLKAMHPEAKIVVQTILPHAAERSTWESRALLLSIPNERIQDLNNRLALLAEKEDVEYLDLQTLFRDAKGNLKLDLTTDGLHLNDNGYRVWASALRMHRTLALDI